MKCKCLLELSDLLKETFSLIWQHCLLHLYPLSLSSSKHMSFDLKPNQEKYNFISAYYKLTILTENNVQFLIMKKARKRLFPTFVQTLVLNMTFFFTVIKEGVHLKTSTMKSLKREVADSHQCAKYKVEAQNSSTAHKWTFIFKIHQRTANKRRHIQIFFVCYRGDTTQYDCGFRSWELGLYATGVPNF